MMNEMPYFRGGKTVRQCRLALVAGALLTLTRFPVASRIAFPTRRARLPGARPEENRRPVCFRGRVVLKRQDKDDTMRKITIIAAAMFAASAIPAF
ncbi:hypothetical protein JS562_14160, partial [Agrobacterium sp. S2]|nr:hypothetical protein [Agrobacterium sp. S2]